MVLYVVKTTKQSKHKSYMQHSHNTDNAGQAMCEEYERYIDE